RHASRWLLGQPRGDRGCHSGATWRGSCTGCGGFERGGRPGTGSFRSAGGRGGGGRGELARTLPGTVGGVQGPGADFGSRIVPDYREPKRPQGAEAAPARNGPGDIAGRTAGSAARCFCTTAARLNLGGDDEEIGFYRDQRRAVACIAIR